VTERWVGMKFRKTWAITEKNSGPGEDEREKNVWEERKCVKPRQSRSSWDIGSGGEVLPEEVPLQGREMGVKWGAWKLVGRGRSGMREAPRLGSVGVGNGLQRERGKRQGEFGEDFIIIARSKAHVSGGLVSKTEGGVRPLEGWGRPSRRRGFGVPAYEQSGPAKKTKDSLRRRRSSGYWGRQKEKGVGRQIYGNVFNGPVRWGGD